MLTREQIVTIEVLQQRGQSQRQTARILGVSEGAVRYHLRRARDGAADGRQKPSRIEQLGLVEAVAHWWQAQAEILGQERPPSVLPLHEFLRAEYGYNGSYKSVRKFVRARYGRPPLRPFRRVETPAGAQTQSDWGEFRRVDLGDPDGPTTIYAFVMVLSHSRKEAVVWSRSMDQLAWHHVHNEAYRRLGGVAAVNRIDNLKTGITRGCGAWGQINEQYRVYARMMGFHVDACEVRAPEQKGKTERRVGDCKGLDVQDRRFDGLAGLQSWIDADRAARASSGSARRPASRSRRAGRRRSRSCGRCRSSCPSRSTRSRRPRCIRTARFISRDVPISSHLFTPAARWRSAAARDAYRSSTPGPPRCWSRTRGTRRNAS